MSTLLETLLRLTVLGSLLTGVVLLLERVFRRRLSRAAGYYLWLLVLLRLCLPFGVTLRVPAAEGFILRCRLRYPTLRMEKPGLLFLRTAVSEMA